MPKEFLHEVVKKREQHSLGSTLSAEWVRRQYDQMSAAYTRVPIAATDPWTYGYGSEYAISDGGILRALIPNINRTDNPIEALLISPQARGTASLSGAPRTTGNILDIAVQSEQGRMFRRTMVRIGNVPEHMLSMQHIEYIVKHAYTMLHTHSCYPDYNVTGASVSTQVEYSCAWCNQRFMGGFA